jgi:hypothetical protein
MNKQVDIVGVACESNLNKHKKKKKTANELIEGAGAQTQTQRKHKRSTDRRGSFVRWYRDRVNRRAGEFWFGNQSRRSPGAFPMIGIGFITGNDHLKEEEQTERERERRTITRR